MRSVYVPQTRAERLVAGGRFVLAAFSLLAIWFDPSTPARFAGLTYGLMAVYAAYALVIFLSTWPRPSPSMRGRILSHVFDLAAFSIFIYLTEGPVSPFFLYFVFSLFCATLRFRPRGILWTAVAALSVYAGMGFYQAVTLHDPEFELNRFVIRNVYLAVLAALLYYLGRYQYRLHVELASLADWPRSVPKRFEELLDDTLRRAAKILDASRVLLAWEIPEEPWLHLAHWNRDSISISRQSAADYDPLVTEPLATTDFLCRDASSPVATILYEKDGKSLEWKDFPLHARVQKEFEIRGCLALRLEAESVAGRLFLLDLDEMTPDDLVLGQVVAHLVSARIDQYFFLQQTREQATSQERMRLSRDLHDGILQSLTGVALQIQAIRDEVSPETERLGARLGAIQEVLEADQRELRATVRALRPGESTEDADFVLGLRLDQLKDRFFGDWRMRVEIRKDLRQPLPRFEGVQIYRIANEALTNAARHGKATRATVVLSSDDQWIRLVVTDNGSGFPFRGTFDLNDLNQSGEGPRTLKERISALGGDLEIESSAAGSTLQIVLPLPAEGADVAGATGATHRFS